MADFCVLQHVNPNPIINIVTYLEIFSKTSKTKFPMPRSSLARSSTPLPGTSLAPRAASLPTVAETEAAQRSPACRRRRHQSCAGVKHC